MFFSSGRRVHSLKAPIEHSLLMVNASSLDVKVKKLWNAVKRKGIGDFSDYEYRCSDRTETAADEAILRIISWGPYREGIQKSVEERVLKAYEKLGKPLHELSTEEARGLGRLYRLSRHEGGSRWQMSFLLSLVRFLRQHKLTMLDLKNSLKDDPPEVAELVLQTALGTSSTKIVHCYMRDCLKLEAFPIDRGVKKVLKRAGIPERPWPIIYSCRRQGIKVRVLARACNIYSDGLLQ